MTRSSVRKWIRDGGWERQQDDETKSQTDKQWGEGQVKCGRNVTDSWGRHVDPSPHTTGGFQVSHPPPPFTRGCQASLKETRSVPLGKSYKSWERGICICSLSSQNKASVLSGVSLGAATWGMTGKGPAWTHKLRGLNLNITSIKTWPKYCVCAAEFFHPVSRLKIDT